MRRFVEGADRGQNTVFPECLPCRGLNGRHLDRDAVLAFVLPAWNIYLIENSAIGEMYFMGLFPASKLFD